jgi:hypothetical protein
MDPERDAEPADFSTPGMMGAEMTGGGSFARGLAPATASGGETKGGAGLEARASRLSLLRLLLAPGTGGATVGGVAARCVRRVRRLCRSCDTESDHCYQQHCSDDLHGISPFR